jgi:CRP-like cAMP-binding protein
VAGFSAQEGGPENEPRICPEVARQRSTFDIELAGAVIERVLPVTVFGEMALIDALPRSATARAASDRSLAVVDQQRFLRLVELTPYFALHMMQLITARLRRVNRH